MLETGFRTCTELISFDFLGGTLTDLRAAEETSGVEEKR